ncbi:hypothetical protein [Mycoplasmopsis cynos]|nr:hypothetical protein [Mycoplasmopsis cynos]WAM04368.1 hypothetical protein ONA01_05035 [Mycoplasmopsis cynos]WAM07866.1 hypothetical protein ONA21_00555 [Mycoplasmopsis cynos]
MSKLRILSMVFDNKPIFKPKASQESTKQTILAIAIEFKKI